MDQTASNASPDSARLPVTSQPEVLIPDYSPDEIQYLGALQKMLENARNLRDTNHDEYDGMTYIEQWDVLQISGLLAGWPRDLGFDAFCRWFDFQHHSMLVDLSDEPLIAELDWLVACVVQPEKRCDLFLANDRMFTKSCANCARRFSLRNWRVGSEMNRLGREISGSMSSVVGLISNTIQCWWTYPMNR